jgi:hypothetical protein
VWDGSNWTQKSPQASPLKNNDLAIAYDSAHGQVVLFGRSSLGASSETWVWDGTNWTLKSPQNSPPGRYAAAMAYDSARSQIVLFGGFDEAAANMGVFEALADTWVWDGSNWNQKSAQTSPPARDFFAMVYDDANSQVVLFGEGPKPTLSPTRGFGMAPTGPRNSHR